MTAPRLDVDLAKIGHNARTLVERLGQRGIAVTAVTKGTLGSAAIAHELVRAGVAGLGDSRIENIEALREAGITAPITLIRSPMLSQVDRVVAHADVSASTSVMAMGARRMVPTVNNSCSAPHQPNAPWRAVAACLDRSLRRAGGAMR